MAATPKGYCAAADVAALLGVALTPELAAHLDPLIAAAEASIDAYTGHAWLELGDHDEPHLISRPHLSLRALPVASIEAVLYLASGPVTTEPTTLEPTSYVLLDAARGALWLGATWTWPYGAAGYGPWPVWLRVQYTPEGTTVPAEVAVACAETAATAYRRSADQSTAGAVASGIKRYSVGQELTVEYADAASASASSGSGGSYGLPPAAQSALAPWRPALAWA